MVGSTESALDVIRTCRAIRRYTTEDVSDRDVADLIDAGIRAPSGGNAQNWRFIVVRDHAVKAALAAEVRRGTRWKITVDQQRIAAMRQANELGSEDEERFERGLAAFRHLADHYEETPVLICVCALTDQSTRRATGTLISIRSAIREYGVVGTLRFAAAGRRNIEQGLWAAAYPAVQNILLAARAKGLGAVLTTPHLLAPPRRIESILGLPKRVKLAAIIPVGHPRGRFGPVARAPIGRFVFEDRFGQEWVSAGRA